MNPQIELERGQLVCVRRGHYLGGESPAPQLGLVLTPSNYHQVTKGALIALVSALGTHYPLEVALPDGYSGRVVLSDHLIRCRFEQDCIEVIDTLPNWVVNHVLGKLEALFRV